MSFLPRMKINFKRKIPSELNFNQQVEFSLHQPHKWAMTIEWYGDNDGDVVSRHLRFNRFPISN
jgi:hypothetical protein